MDSNTTNGNVQNAKDSVYSSQVFNQPSYDCTHSANMSVLQFTRSSRDLFPHVLTSTTDAQSAANTIQNHPATQSVKDTLNNGPVADMAKDQHAKTTSEFSNLANSRTTPDQSAATGQPLTHYHSFFYNLLSVSYDLPEYRIDQLMAPVGKSSCHHPILHLYCTLHLRRPLPACSSLVIQGSLYGAW